MTTIKSAYNPDHYRFERTQSIVMREAEWSQRLPPVRNTWWRRPIGRVLNLVLR